MYNGKTGCTSITANCTTPAAKSIRAMTGTLSNAKEPPRFCSDAFGRGCALSLTKKISPRDMMLRAPAATKKDIRIPNTSAKTPPNKGPKTPPAVIPPCMMPRHEPIFSRGAVEVMMARQAGQRPAEKPWKQRMAKSSQGVETKPPQT